MKTSRRVASLALATAIGVGGSVGLAPSAEADTLLAGFYTGANGTGAARNYWHSSSGYVCTSSTSDWDGWGSSSAFLVGFNNDIESFFGNYEAGCWVKLWDSSNWTGTPTYGYTAQAATLPSNINNRTSSVGIS